MANTFAYIVLFGWPLVVILLFRLLPRPEALCWSIIGGYLALPYGVGVNPPVLPTFDKTLIPALSAGIMCLLGIAPVTLLARRRGLGKLENASIAALHGDGQPVFTRQQTRRPVRISAGPILADGEMDRLPRVIPLLAALLFLTQAITFLQNTEPYQIGGLTLPGLQIYDAFSMTLNTMVMLLPFLLGALYLGQPEAHVSLLRVLCFSALIYSLLALFEIRMSPQLARWTYGFLEQSFAQAMRDGGFRPVVFLQHGLWLAIYTTMAALGAFALWRHGRAEGRYRSAIWAGLWLAGVLFLSRSLGAFVLLVGLTPVVMLLSIRGQLFVAAILAAIILTYPVLRGAGLVPVDAVYALSASISEDRAQSFKFRLDNEDMLLAHANEKALSGWGGFGRARVFSAETGADISITDGMWIIVMGVSGWPGYVGTFGLLAVPPILLFFRGRQLDLAFATSGLCVILVVNLIDMIANATLTPVTWLVAGALVGRCRFRMGQEQVGFDQKKRRDLRLGPKSVRSLLRLPALHRLMRLALALAFLIPISPASAGTGLSNPTLSFGLSSVSDWSTQMPFLDLMKMSRPWIGHSSTAWSAMTTDQLVSGGYLDANGWPVRIPDGLTSIGTVWDWGSSAADANAAASRAGIYVLTYEGEGTLQIQGATMLSSGPGRMVVQNLTGETMMLNITATDPNHTGKYIHNISLVPQEYEALHDAGQIFNPDWLAIVQDARELRFMDWMGANGVTHASWADRPQVGDVSWAGGVPVEVMVELANQTGTEPWFNMPAGADDAYIRNFATYVRDHLNPDLQVHVEYSNEMWNWAFGQTQWLGTQAKTVWGSTDGAAWLDYAAMLATKSALIWDGVFGAAADVRVDNVMGTQTANAWIAGRLLTAPIWKTVDPSGYVDPSTIFDSLAVTTYFGGDTMANGALRDQLLAVLKTPGVDATTWLAAKLMDPTYSQSIPQIEAWWTANKAVADKYGMDLVAYEGGQHVLHSFAVGGLPEADLATLTTFLTGFVRSQAMAELYHELWTAWAAVSDGPFMQYGDVATANKYGAWGLFSALGDHNPRADLLMDLNAHTAAWFGTGGGMQYQQGVIKVAVDVGETLIGTDDDDFLIGGLGKDVIVAGKGHDAISGGRGVDTLVLTGSPSDYILTAEDDGYRLTGPGTSHYIRGIENFTFDGNLNLSLAEVLRE